MTDNRDWEVKASEPGIKGKTIQDFLYFEGMYNPILRFAFTNVLDTEFVSYWNSKKYVIRPHETVKVPHYLACKFTKEAVDKAMQADNKGLLMAVPANRKPYEDKVLAMLPNEDKDELEVIRNEFVDQVIKDSQRPMGVPDEPLDNLELNFEDLRTKNFTDPTPETKPIPATPSISVAPEKKRGRPKKS